MRLNSYLVIIYTIFCRRIKTKSIRLQCVIFGILSQLFESIITGFLFFLHLSECLSLQTDYRIESMWKCSPGKCVESKHKQKTLARQTCRRFIAQYCWDLIKVNKMSISAIVEFHFIYCNDVAFLCRCSLYMREQRGSEHSTTHH